MASPVLAVLLRNGPHDSASVRYALKCSDIAVSVARTPIQIPLPQQSPELIDIGYSRPSITLTGVVDTVGGDTGNVGAGAASGYAGMASFGFSRASYSGSGWDDGGSGTTYTYYIPYKNALEEACTTWIYTGTNELELEIGDATFPIGAYQGHLPDSSSNRYSGTSSNHATGGAIYKVAVQQSRFQLNAAREDRYDFSIQFISEFRIDYA